MDINDIDNNWNREINIDYRNLRQLDLNLLETVCKKKIKKTIQKEI